MAPLALVSKGPGTLNGVVKLWMICLFLVLPGLQMNSKADHNPQSLWKAWSNYGCLFFGTSWTSNELKNGPDNGSEHIPSIGKRCVGHFYAPSRCHPRSRWAQKTAKWLKIGQTMSIFSHKWLKCYIQLLEYPILPSVTQNVSRFISLDIFRLVVGIAVRSG